MTRQSKQGERRAISPRRPRSPYPKTSAKRDNLPFGFKKHENAIEGEVSDGRFFPKMK
jgi:hypothetical protein